MGSQQLHIELPPRYRVQRHIATGGMASVYAATDEVLGREVAIKVLSPALVADDAARERFSREGRAAARVSDHPNVVTIYDISENDGDPPLAFIVMELLSGGTVHDRLRAGEPIPHTLALRWLEQTASALDAAHAEGMVHRDVKPANLLLDASENVKVADFGIALLATDAPLTQTGQVVGTATYFSPEQAMGKPATAASDRFSLAVVAYELLTGHRPFPPGPPAAQALARIESDPPPAGSLAPGLPRQVDAVLARGLAKEPGHRPATAGEFVAALHAALGPTATTGIARPVAAAAEGTPRAAAAAAAPRPRTPRPAPVPVAAAAPRRRSNRTGVLAAIAALLLVTGAAIAAIAGGGDDPQESATRTPTTQAAKEERKPKTEEEPTTTASDTTAEQAPQPAQDTGGAPEDAAAIQAEAHEKLGAGDYNGAVQMLTGLVERCPVEITNPCAYAWYDLGYALRRIGRPDLAVGVLETRLQNPDQAETVQAELDAARAEAAGATADSPGDGKGKAKGHSKDDDD